MSQYTTGTNDIRDPKDACSKDPEALARFARFFAQTRDGGRASSRPRTVYIVDGVVCTSRHSALDAKQR